MRFTCPELKSYKGFSEESELSSQTIAILCASNYPVKQELREGVATSLRQTANDVRRMYAESLRRALFASAIFLSRASFKTNAHARRDLQSRETVRCFSMQSSSSATSNGFVINSSAPYFALASHL